MDKKKFIPNSNAIEGYLGAEYGHGSIEYDQHLETYIFLCENEINLKCLF